jgi:methylated-DNA-[protein]-cysteine S-methyltransferase
MTLATAVYTLCSQIPKGRVTTYKAIADKLGNKSYRAIGQVLSKNPFPPAIPCHRVISTTGRISGYKGEISKKSIEIKISLLRGEGVIINSGRINLQKYLYSFET